MRQPPGTCLGVDPGRGDAEELSHLTGNKQPIVRVRPRGSLGPLSALLELRAEVELNAHTCKVARAAIYPPPSSLGHPLSMLHRSDPLPYQSHDDPPRLQGDHRLRQAAGLPHCFTRAGTGHTLAPLRIALRFKPENGGASLCPVLASDVAERSNDSRCRACRVTSVVMASRVHGPSRHASRLASGQGAGWRAPLDRQIRPRRSDPTARLR
jgi:hypothetical protein